MLATMNIMESAKPEARGLALLANDLLGISFLRFHDPSRRLPDRLRHALHGLEEAQEATTTAVETLLEHDHRHSHFDKCLKVAGTVLAVVSAGFGVAAVIRGATLVPMGDERDHYSLAGGLGIAAAAFGGMGAVFQVVASGVYKSRLKHFNTKASSYMSDFKKHLGAAENALKRIVTSVEHQLRVKAKIKTLDPQKDEAMLMALTKTLARKEVPMDTSPEDDDCSEENSTTESETPMLAFSYIEAFHELEQQLSNIESMMEVQLQEERHRSTTVDIAFHSVSLAMLFSVAILPGASPARMIAFAFFAAVSIADLKVLLGEWHEVPQCVCNMREVQKALRNWPNAVSNVQQLSEDVACTRSKSEDSVAPRKPSQTCTQQKASDASQPATEENSPHLMAVQKGAEKEDQERASTEIVPEVLKDLQRTNDCMKQPHLTEAGERQDEVGARRDMPALKLTKKLREAQSSASIVRGKVADSAYQLSSRKRSRQLADAFTFSSMPASPETTEAWLMVQQPIGLHC